MPHSLVLELGRGAQLHHRLVTVPYSVRREPPRNRHPRRPGPLGGIPPAGRAPGHGSARSGTGRAFCGAFFGYQPVAAGWNSHVANPFRRQCGAFSTDGQYRMYPRSALACSTAARVGLRTVGKRARGPSRLSRAAACQQSGAADTQRGDWGQHGAWGRLWLYQALGGPLGLPRLSQRSECRDGCQPGQLRRSAWREPFACSKA